MRFREYRSLTLMALIALPCPAAASSGYASSSEAPPQDRAVLVILSSPTYPQIARAAHISGDIVLTVTVTKDGGVASAIVESGPALLALRQAAIDSVKQSHFECGGCGDRPETFRIEYSYVLDDPPDPCSDAVKSEYQSYPQISHSGNHVTIVDRAVTICDPPAEPGRVRSVKCLYLWRCAYH
jgi:TonB family protein